MVVRNVVEGFFLSTDVLFILVVCVCVCVFDTIISHVSYLSFYVVAGRCVSCGPEEYLLNETDFLDECRRGSGLFPEEGRRKMEDLHDLDGSSYTSDGFEIVHYETDLVKKAIHLIRNPFHNIVSRFHLERKHFEKRAWRQWLGHQYQTKLRKYRRLASSNPPGLQ